MGGHGGRLGGAGNLEVATEDAGIGRLQVTAEVATRGLRDGDNTWVLASRHRGLRD